MNRTTGIHLTGRTLRVVCLETHSAGTRMVALSETSLSTALHPESLQDAGIRRQLGGEIRAALGNLSTSPGRVIAGLGGGLFQIQKVPLEVASHEDRREQMVWEASQALISPVEDYLIDFFPSGRVAFWVAVRKTVIDLCAEIYAASQVLFQGFVVEPLALFRACEQTGLWEKNLQAAVLLTAPWISFIAADGGMLTTAQTVHTLDLTDAPSEGANSSVSFMTGRVQRWLFGDLAPDRRQTDYRAICLCGDPSQARDLANDLSSGPTPSIEPFQPFSSLDTTSVPDSQRPHLEDACGFGVATGLACWEEALL